MSSQIGYVIALVNENNLSDDTIKIAGNILHWSSTKCKKFTRLVLVSELYAMVAGFDQGVAIQSTLNAIMKQSIPLILCTDSHLLYDCMIHSGPTTEKGLMIDIMDLRESYERRAIPEVRWIDRGRNPANAMTEEKGLQRSPGAGAASRASLESRSMGGI